MFSQSHFLAVGVALFSTVAWPTRLPAQDDDVDRQAVVLYAAAGGFSTLAHLDEPDATNFRTGFNVGAGVGYEFNNYVTLRGNFTFARAKAQSTSGAPLSIVGTEFNRFLYDGDLQLRYPFKGGVAPYIFAGGGAVDVKPDITPAQPSFTKGAGKFGVGISYQIPRSSVGVYVEGTTWVYKWDRYGFDKTQFDTTWSAGITYRLRL